MKNQTKVTLTVQELRDIIEKVKYDKNGRIENWAFDRDVLVDIIFVYAEKNNKISLIFYILTAGGFFINRLSSLSIKRMHCSNMLFCLRT